MYKAISVIVLILLCSETALSQESYFGLKFGYNQSQLIGEEGSGPSLKDRRGSNVSMVFSKHSETVGVSLEPGYILKGTRVDNDTTNYRFHYLNIPLLVDLYPIKKLKLSIGPEFSYLLKGTNIVNDSTKQNLDQTYDRRWEFGGIASASISVLYFMDLGVRYSRSFTKVADRDPIIDRRNLSNQYLQFFVLFKIAN